ncbi:major facilitator superfamily transporter [Fusarium sp. NRRL 52700]|nr:major facilitator superfamily transporter [Fusarium sp. NRRL 52700]
MTAELQVLVDAVDSLTHGDQCAKCVVQAAVTVITGFLQELYTAKKTGKISKEDKRALKSEVEGLVKGIKGDAKLRKKEIKGQRSSFVGQALEGVPWGFFIANSPAYASEIVPLALRGACTATLQRDDQWAWRVPLALQWIFPTPILILEFFAPEYPWWLLRKGRKEEALRSIQRLGNGDTEVSHKKLAMMERTAKIEEAEGRNPSLIDLVKGTDLRRTTITSLIYASQNFAGNLIANQATFFFEQSGVTTERAFQLNIINTCLQFIGNIIAGFFGRRTIYLWGTITKVTLLMILGIVATLHQSTATNYVQAVLGILISFVYALCLGPISYTIIAETSSVRLRALSTGVGRAAYYVAKIPMIYLASNLLNPTGWNLGGQCGYVWGGTAAVFFVSAYFFLPELKNRSYREADILFKRKIPARNFNCHRCQIERTRLWTL